MANNSTYNKLKIVVNVYAGIDEYKPRKLAKRRGFKVKHLLVRRYHIQGKNIVIKTHINTFKDYRITFAVASRDRR